MRVCDRCRKPDPKYHNIYIGGLGRDLCVECNKDYEELTEIYDSMDLEFINNKTLKHIDFIWEDNRI